MTSVTCHSDQPSAAATTRDVRAGSISTASGAMLAARSTSTAEAACGAVKASPRMANGLARATTTRSSVGMHQPTVRQAYRPGRATAIGCVSWPEPNGGGPRFNARRTGRNVADLRLKISEMIEAARGSGSGEHKARVAPRGA
eukprot:scaffold56557_cov27-Tisochrysis_lutea.AAC.2